MELAGCRFAEPQELEVEGAIARGAVVAPSLLADRLEVLFRAVGAVERHRAHAHYCSASVSFGPCGLPNEWIPHSVFPTPSQRPARSSSPDLTSLVQGQHPIEA
jgi:hypothetical protein